MDQPAALAARSLSRPAGIPSPSALVLLRLLVLALALDAPPVGAQGSAVRRADRATERVLFKLENDWAQAVARRDARAIGRLVAPRWVYSDESGVMNRAEGIRSFTSGPDTVRAASNAQMRAIVYPGTAVVIGILEMRGSGPGGPFVRRYRYTDSWMELDGRWQCVASQDYLLPEGAASR